MRFATVLLALAVSMVTQSCRIEMPSLIRLLTEYGSGFLSRPALYDFSVSSAITAQKGFRDTLIIGDDPTSRHGEAVLATILLMNIHENHIVFFERFKGTGLLGNVGLRMLTSGEHESLRRATRVVHLPLLTPLRTVYEAPRIRAHDILFVPGAGNVLDSFENDRDMYNVNHVRWNHPDNPERDARSKVYYESILEVYDTGKAIAATSARVTENGTIEPYERVVQCGDIKESCFTMLPRQATSFASARLSSISFYLSQFFETPEEVVNVLKTCALDIGETGVDREYGNGVVNLFCPPVLKKEISVVSSYLNETKEGEVPQGGALLGTWNAEKTILSVYIPEALQQTLQIDYHGTTTGTIAFTETAVTADFKTEAAISATFLLSVPIRATAEDQVQVAGAYTTEGTLLTFKEGEKPFVYTATEDSLHLIRLYTLNEALSLLPNPLGSMVDMASEDFFTNDPIQVRMSFAKESKIPGDFNDDNLVDFADFLLFVQVFGATTADPVFNEAMDLVPDGMINFSDFLVFVENFGTTSG